MRPIPKFSPFRRGATIRGETGNKGIIPEVSKAGNQLSPGGGENAMYNVNFFFLSAQTSMIPKNKIAFYS